MQNTASQDGATPVEVKIETSDETLVKQYKNKNFELDWEPDAGWLTAVFALHPSDIVFTWHDPIAVKISDYCLGWTLSGIGITINNPKTVYKYIPKVTKHDPALRIEKYLLSEETLFEFQFPRYHQIVDKSRVDFGCGNLQYTPVFWTDTDIRSKLVWNLDMDYIQTESLRFHVDSIYKELRGLHKFEIKIESDVMTHEPHFNIPIEIYVAPCFVRGLDFHDQQVDDIILLY